jgi:hypothetical protein
VGNVAEVQTLPISFRYTDDLKGVVLTASGRTTGSEFISVANEVLAGQDQSKCLRHALADLIEITDFDVSAAEIREIVALSRKRMELAPHPVAVAIAASKRVVLGMARMWELLVDWDGWNIRICESLLEAENWLKEEMARGPEVHPNHHASGSGGF